MFKRSRRRLTGWLVVAAVALHLLGPWLTQALAAGSATPDFWEVCTAHGPASLAGAPAAPVPDDALAAADHCPYCLLHLAHWAPAPQAAALFARSAPRFALPEREAHAAFQPRDAWATPQSRAPPALS